LGRVGRQKNNPLIKPVELRKRDKGDPGTQINGVVSTVRSFQPTATYQGVGSVVRGWDSSMALMTMDKRDAGTLSPLPKKHKKWEVMTTSPLATSPWWTM